LNLQDYHTLRKSPMKRLTREQVREIDRRSIEEFGIPGIVLMENAAIAATDVAMEMLNGAASALILCGGGNNGGDGLAVARHLHNHGVDVSIAVTVDPKGYKGDALINWNIVRKMQLPWRNADPEVIAQAKSSLIIDAICGNRAARSTGAGDRSAQRPGLRYGYSAGRVRSGDENDHVRCGEDRFRESRRRTLPRPSQHRVDRLPARIDRIDPGDFGPPLPIPKTPSVQYDAATAYV
jgi:YjeF-like protein